MMRLLDPNKVDTAVLHVTASHYGNVKIINRMHRDRGWNMIGYHYLITNVFPTYEDLRNMTPRIDQDGAVYIGRLTKFQGAHVKGHNDHTISVALVGTYAMQPFGAIFSAKQLESACDVISNLMISFPKIMKIKGHNEFPDVNKGCPLINMNHFREMFNDRQNP